MGFQIKTYTLSCRAWFARRPEGYEIPTAKIRDEAPAISLVHLSDLHLQQFGHENEQLRQSIFELEPDAVLITGDMVTAKRGLSLADTVAFLCRLAGRFPVYYVNGNHEQRMKENRDSLAGTYGGYRDALTDAGIVFLENESRKMVVRGIPLCIYGLELPLPFFGRLKKIRLDKDDIVKRIGLPSSDCLNILLTHHPRFWETYADWGADLTLCGHIHGGVIRLGRYAVASPDGRIFPLYGYGRHERDGRTLIVSAGLGEHTLPFRILNPKELVHIVIKQEASHGDTR